MTVLWMGEKERERESGRGCVMDERERERMRGRERGCVMDERERERISRGKDGERVSRMSEREAN